MGNEKPKVPGGNPEKEKTEQTCPVCHGAGNLEKTPDNYVTCKRCNGNGWVLK